jgi:hypothetical protein
MQFASNRHVPCLGLAHELFPIGDVRCTDAARYQRFDIHADQFVDAIAEHAAGLGVCQDDEPPGIDHQQRGGRGFEDHAEAMLAFAQLQLASLQRHRELRRPDQCAPRSYAMTAIIISAGKLNVIGARS